MLTAGLVSLLFKMFKQPLVLGYIVAGVCIGPYALGEAWIADGQSAEEWGKLGVLFVLFSLGLEFSFKKLIKVGATAFIGAVTIVAGMMTLGYSVGALVLGYNDINALFLGGMLCMSSTTIVFKAIEEKKLGSEKFVKVAIGILIVEDLFAVVLMVLLSSIAVRNSFEGKEMIMQIGKLVGCIALWFVCGITLLPTVMRRVRRHLSDETLVIFAVAMCLAMVFTAMEAGFSDSLGAFVMGSILAETIEAERIERLVTPLKNLFASIFFVTVGMMIDPDTLLQYWVPILILVVVVVGGQIVFASLGALLAGQPLRVALQTSFSLVQIGEFAFIIATLGSSLGVTDTSLYPIVVAVSVITTFLTPYLMNAAIPVHNFIDARMSDDLKHFLSEYSAQRNGDGKSSPLKQQLAHAWEVLVVLIDKIPVFRLFVRQFSRNLYAREAYAASQRSLSGEVERTLSSLDIKITEVVLSDKSNFAGQKLKALRLRNTAGVSLIRIVRGGLNINVPGGDSRLFPNDRLVVAGSEEQTEAFIAMLKKSEMPVDKAAFNDNSEIVLENFVVTEGSPLIGIDIITSQIRDVAHCAVMCIVRPDEGLLLNPDPKTRFKQDDIVVVAGSKDDIAAYKQSLSA